MHSLDKGHILIHQVDDQQLQGLCEGPLKAVNLHRAVKTSHLLSRTALLSTQPSTLQDHQRVSPTLAAAAVAGGTPLLLRAGCSAGAAGELAAEEGMLKAMTLGSRGPTSASSFPVKAARSLSPRSLDSHTSCHAACSTSGLHGRGLQHHTHSISTTQCCLSVVRPTLTLILELLQNLQLRPGYHVKGSRACRLQWSPVRSNELALPGAEAAVEGGQGALQEHSGQGSSAADKMGQLSGQAHSRAQPVQQLLCQGQVRQRRQGLHMLEVGV